MASAGTAAAASLSILPAAAAAIGTADALSSVFLRFIDVKTGRTNDYNQNCNNNYIFHNRSSEAPYFFPARAFFAASFLSVFTHRSTTKPIITHTAIRPGKKPLPTVPSVIRVPI